MNSLTLIVSSMAELTGAAGWVERKLRDRLTFPNPEWIENDRRGFSNWNTPRELCFLEKESDRIIMPRGFTRQVVHMLRVFGVQFRIEDKRRTLPQVDFNFRGELRDYQQAALADILRRDFGTLPAPTGSGKTVIALAAIAARKQPALVVCHTRELADQWVDRIETFLGVPAKEVGIIGNGRREIGERITVGLVQSLYKVADQVVPHVGHLVVDECHRAPSRTFTEAVTAFDCRYMMGLSATPFRRDGLSRLIYWHLGDVVHKIDQGPLIEAGSILQAEVIVRETDFRPTVDPSEQYSTMLSELTHDPARNGLIVADVVAESRNGGGTCLVLSDRKSHCQALADLLTLRGVRAEVLTGSLAPRQRRGIIGRLNRGKIGVLVATGQLIGEGFDCRGLSTLFLACPIRFSGRLLQYLGRVLRPAHGKSRARVYDYIDPVGVLRSAARARRRVYEAAAREQSAAVSSKDRG